MFNREYGGLHSAALLLAMSTIVSSALGLFRDRLLAGAFGAGKSLDIYYASFKIPDLLYIIALAIVSVTVLIPFFIEKLSVSKEEAQSFFDQIFTAFLLVMIFLSAIFFLLAPYFAKLVAPGFSPADTENLIILTRIMLLSPILLGFSNLISTVIQSFRRFFIYALSPIFYNLSIIAGIIFFYPVFGLEGIVFGVVLGALLHAFIQIPSLRKLGFAPRLSLSIDFKNIKRVFLFSFPRALGLGMNQIVLIFITAIASLLGAGSIAVFNLSFNVQAVLLSVIGISYSVAAFPALAKLFENNQRKDFLAQTFVAARQIIFWSLPLSALFIVLRAQIVRVIFGTGAFGWTDTKLVAAGLAIFSLSAAAQSLVVLFVRAFYAAGRTFMPLAVNVVSSLIIIILALIFITLPENGSFAMFFEKMLRVENTGNISVLMLPLAFSIGMIINAFLIARFFKKELGWFRGALMKVFFETLSASLVVGFTAYVLLRALDNVFNTSTAIGIFMQGFVAGMAGIGAGVIVLLLMKNREIREIAGAFKQKFWKAKPIAPGPEGL